MKNLLLTAVLAPLLIGLDAKAQAPAGKIDPVIERAVMQTLKDYMDAFNRLDMPAFERTLHFPHYRLASSQMTVLDRPGLQTAKQFQRMLGSDWDHSQWGHLRIIHWSPDKVHVDTLFTRYRKDGSVINSFESLYVVTKEDGRWGVKLRSSMAP